MTLEEALQHLGARVGDAEVDRRRERAAAVVHDVIQKLSRTAKLDWETEADRLDACQTLLMRLVRWSSRLQPRSRGYLSKALHNLRTDQARAKLRRLEVSEQGTGGENVDATPRDQTLGVAFDGPAADELLDQRREAEAFQRCEGLLREVVVPRAVAARRGDAARQLFLRSCEELFALSDQEKTLAQILGERRAELGGADGPEEEKRLRNLLDQHHTRARKHLLEALRVDTFADDDHVRLRARIQGLRQRPD